MSTLLEKRDNIRIPSDICYHRLKSSPKEDKGTTLGECFLHEAKCSFFGSADLQFLITQLETKQGAKTGTFFISTIFLNIIDQTISHFKKIMIRSLTNNKNNC